MHKFTKYLLLLVASVLALSGMQADHSAEVYRAVLETAAGKQTQASFSAGESVKFPSLIRTEEQVSLVHHVPGPPSKTQSGELRFQSFAAELHIECAIAQYISRAANFSRSLAGSDIIFPFHYFW